MSSNWHDFLIQQGARASADGELGFAEPEAPTPCRLFSLSHLGLIAARGADARDFLQGQLTNDIRELSPEHSQLSGYCTQKGRLLASFRLFAIGDAIYLQTPVERIAEVLKRLRIYVLRSKVTLEDASDALARLGIAGDTAAALLVAQGLQLPERENAQTQSAEVTLVRLPGVVPRYEVLGPADAMMSLWEALAVQAAPANRAAWTLLDIEAGIPSVYDATAEAFVPQMTNLHLLDGVSFHKGCYTGQEVVARMQFLGKLKRRMYLAEAPQGTHPARGDELFSTSSTSQQASGRIVDVAPRADGSHALLVVAEISAAEQGDLRLGDAGPALALREPPYGFADRDSNAAAADR